MVFAEVTYKEVTSGQGCQYEIYRIWTAEDACGNTTTHKQTIVVSDTEAPTFVESLPTDVAVACDAIPAIPTITATDNCGAAEVTYKEVTSGQGCQYEIYRIWTAEDACGNTTTHKQTIVVSDTEAPTFVESLPTDVAVACDAIPAIPTITATDNCGAAEVTYKEVTSGQGCQYEIYRIWTAEDACGNTTTHKQTIVVSDTEAPTFVESLPTDVAVACDAIPAIPTITATDNCGAAEVTYKEVTSGQGCQYEIYRIWTAEDACGNTTTHKQTIVVSDTEAPTFVESLPADVAVACDAIPAIPAITATDNCSEVEVSYKEVRSNDNDCDYEIYRIWTAEDACGNTIVHKQTIVVLPASNPQGPQRGIFDSNVSFDVYPLPFVDDLTIRYTFDYNSPVQVEVYDLKGRLIHKANDTNGYLNKEYTINLTTVRESSQVYILKVITDRGSETKKIISANR
ncbi:T9SS type A sorting domain-containing protein [Flavobacterium piscinae]|uniref:T9SS type A sorting domain-containing protein n=1 Tax=Flavobacterium piscinae TaxID=2506424 RepID=UPI0019B7C23B|nr:T9SS type A sorting domain-containing protein [Flavobacterium piscinae]MBC8884401.1 T9SS type A sorting domain-containing protein [Flavobacterium piscinae]